MIWTGHILRRPGKCFPVKAEFLKIGDGDIFPFVLRTEKEELQEQSNGFRLVIGKNIRSHKLYMGISRRNIHGFKTLQGSGEEGPECT